MKPFSLRPLALAAAVCAVCAVCAVAAAPAHADVVVTEVSSYSSGNAAFAADWFEVTNTGAAAVTVSGWKVDDSSNSFASALALTGITSIAAGESVIFIEAPAASSPVAGFLAHWFGASAPAGLQVGTYTGAGIGLSTGGDAVNLFDSAGTRLAGVAFTASTTGQTFDNAAGLNSLTLPLPVLSTLSVLGVNGAFSSVAALASGVPVGTLDIGSPGIAAVPEASTTAMMLAGLVGMALLRRSRL